MEVDKKLPTIGTHTPMVVAKLEHRWRRKTTDRFHLSTSSLISLDACGKASKTEHSIYHSIYYQALQNISMPFKIYNSRATVVSQKCDDLNDERSCKTGKKRNAMRWNKSDLSPANFWAIFLSKCRYIAWGAASILCVIGYLSLCGFFWTKSQLWSGFTINIEKQ